MEKKMFKFIPKPVTFQNQPFHVCPNKFKTHVGIGFSGQLIPAETHRRSAREEEVEPTSPKISCMGRIKHKNMQRKNKRLAEAPEAKTSSLGGFFAKPQGKRSGAPRPPPKLPERAPNIGQLRKFSSGRDTLAGFDWRTQAAAEDAKHGSHCPTEDGEDEVKIPFSAPIVINKLGESEKEDGILRPKKEINLWKRRTMSQPRPLQVAPF